MRLDNCQIVETDFVEDSIDTTYVFAKKATSAEGDDQMELVDFVGDTAGTPDLSLWTMSTTCIRRWGVNNNYLKEFFGEEAVYSFEECEEKCYEEWKS